MLDYIPRWLVKTAISTSDSLCATLSWTAANAEYDDPSTWGGSLDGPPRYVVTDVPMPPLRNKNQENTYHTPDSLLRKKITSADIENLDLAKNGKSYLQQWRQQHARDDVEGSEMLMQNPLCLEEIWKDLDPSLADDDNLTTLSMGSSAEQLPPIPTEVLVDDNHVFAPKHSAQQREPPVFMPPRPLSRTAPRRISPTNSPRSSTSTITTTATPAYLRDQRQYGMPQRALVDESEAGLSTILSSLGSASVARPAEEEDSLLIGLEQIRVHPNSTNGPKEYHPMPNIVETDTEGESSSNGTRNSNSQHNKTTRKIDMAPPPPPPSKKVSSAQTALSEASSCIFSEEGRDAPPKTGSNQPAKTTVTSASEASTLFSCEELRSAYHHQHQQAERQPARETSLRQSPPDPPACGPQVLQRPTRIISPPILLRNAAQRRQQEHRTGAESSFDPWSEIDGANRVGHEEDDDDSCSSFLVRDADKKVLTTTQVHSSRASTSSCFTYSTMDDGEEKVNQSPASAAKDGLLRMKQKCDQPEEEEAGTQCHSSTFPDGSSYSTDYNEQDQSHDEHVLLGTRQIQLILHTPNKPWEQEPPQQEDYYSNKYVYPYHSSHMLNRDDDDASVEISFQHPEREEASPVQEPQPSIHRSHWFLPAKSTMSTTPETAATSWSRISTPSQSPLSSPCQSMDEKSI